MDSNPAFAHWTAWPPVIAPKERTVFPWFNIILKRLEVYLEIVWIGIKLPWRRETSSGLYGLIISVGFIFFVLWLGIN